MRILTRSAARGALCALVTFTAACGEDPNTLDPNIVTLVELQDFFSYSVTGLDNVTDFKRHWWVMGGDQAIIDVTSGITDGSVLLQLRGGDGTVVYLEDIADAVDTLTAASFPGVWQLDVIYDEASGDFSFTLERDTIP